MARSFGLQGQDILLGTSNSKIFRQIARQTMCGTK